MPVSIQRQFEVIIVKVLWCKFRGKMIAAIKSENHHARPVTEGPKLRCYTAPRPPLNEGLALINPVFCPTSSTDQKHLKLGMCLEIDDRRSLSKFGDVT